MARIKAVFEQAPPGDTSSTDRLGWLTTGMLREREVSAGAEGKHSQQTQIGELWIELGRLIERFNKKEDEAKPTLVWTIGPIQDQKL